MMGLTTNDQDETNIYLLNKYFPEDNPDDDSEEMRRTRMKKPQYTDRDEPNIVREEVTKILRRRNSSNKNVGRTDTSV